MRKVVLVYFIILETIMMLGGLFLYSFINHFTILCIISIIIMIALGFIGAYIEYKYFK